MVEVDTASHTPMVSDNLNTSWSHKDKTELVKINTGIEEAVKLGRTAPEELEALAYSGSIIGRQRGRRRRQTESWQGQQRFLDAREHLELQAVDATREDKTIVQFQREGSLTLWCRNLESYQDHPQKGTDWHGIAALEESSAPMARQDQQHQSLAGFAPTTC